jgi:hypothetical protein
MGNHQKDNCHNLIIVLTKEHFFDCIYQEFHLGASYEMAASEDANIKPPER